MLVTSKEKEPAEPVDYLFSFLLGVVTPPTEAAMGDDMRLVMDIPMLLLEVVDLLRSLMSGTSENLSCLLLVGEVSESKLFFIDINFIIVAYQIVII